MKFSKIIIGLILISVLCTGVQALGPIISANNQTSNSGSAGFNQSASNELASFEAYKLFDGDNATRWYSNANVPQWIEQYIPGSKVATAYMIVPYGSTAYEPYNFTFSGSNDNSTFTTLDTRTGQENWVGVPRTFTFSNTNSYNWYRLSVSRNNGTTPNAVTIYEMYIFGPELAPVASFTPVSSSGTSPLSVSFTDTSSNTPTYWNWTIEGKIGNTTKYLNASTLQNPTFTFLPGNYTISLGAGDSAGYNISTQNSWVNTSAGIPTVSFTTNVSSGVAPLALYLNDTSTGSPTMWNTSWGDTTWTNETSFPETNITHVYSTAGSFTITHYATNDYGTGSATTGITVYGPAYAQFSSFNTLGGAPFTTYLYDTSTNLTPGPATYYWDFGDGNTSTEQNLFYTWNITGTYTVKHSMDNGLSVNWSNVTAYVTVGTATIAPVASFYGGPQIGDVPLTVFFTDVSTNTPTSWFWEFGDGTNSTLQNPNHTYTRSGFRTVNLTATNTAGSNITVKTKFVKVS